MIFINCPFCEGKRVSPVGFGSSGIHTISQNLAYLFGRSDDKEPEDYIKLEKTNNKYFLAFQNSSEEYSDGFVEIHYCPLCGKKLDASGKSEIITLEG